MGVENAPKTFRPRAESAGITGMPKQLQVPIPGGFGFPLGFLLGALVTMATVALGATRAPIMSLVALVAVVDLVALTSTFRATLGTALVCWALHAGFVLGRHVEIAFTG